MKKLGNLIQTNKSGPLSVSFVSMDPNQGFVQRNDWREETVFTRVLNLGMDGIPTDRHHHLDAE